MGAAPIRIEHLNHHFGKGALRKQILFDVGVEIPQGEIVIVTGPSGSGKTTLLTLVGALRSAQEGSIEVLGQQLRGAKPGVLEKVRQSIGFIFQQHNLLGALSAVQNVELGLRVTGRYPSPAQRRKLAIAMLEAVGLGHRIHYKAEQLSGGQRQRVAIARALVNQPSILLADEPTGNLDSATSQEIMVLFEALHTEGQTIVLVTHENDIAAHARRQVHLKDGRVERDFATDGRSQ